MSEFYEEFHSALKASNDRRPHEHDWSDWYKPAFYRDSLGNLLNDVGMGRLSGTDDPATSGWVRACRTCDTEQHA